MAQRRLQRGPADIVEVHIDALGAVQAQRVVQVGGLVVECRIEAAAFEYVGHLVVAAGRADHPRSGPLGELPGELPDRSGGRRDVDGVARCRHAQFDGADPGGQAGHAECRDGQAHPAQRGVDAIQPFAPGHCDPLRPVEESPDVIAHRELGILGGDHPPHHPRHDRLVQREARCIGWPLVHPAPQIRVGGQVQRLDQHILGADHRLRTGLQGKTRGIGPAGGALDEQDPSVHGWLHCPNRPRCGARRGRACRCRCWAPWACPGHARQ